MINLEHLTEQERKIIMDVLQRDEQLRQSEQERVKKLKTELHELRRKSAVKVDEDSGDSSKKVCARCREPLGTIFNSGEVCPRCQHKVCSNCKVLLPNTTKWLCTICNKHLQIRLESGEAFGPRGEGQAEAYGSDLVKMSLAKSKTGHEPIVQVNGGPQSPADSGFHGRGGANVPSVGESNSTTFDEDYPSDVSYEQSMVSGMESIGPSVSQRDTVVRYDSSTPSSPWLSPHASWRMASGTDSTSTPPMSEVEDGHSRRYRRKVRRGGGASYSLPNSPIPSSHRPHRSHHYSSHGSLASGSGSHCGQSNGVEGGMHSSADITMERIPSRTGSPASSRRGRQGGEAADYSQYEKSTSRRSNSPAGSRRYRHGSEVSEDERSYRSNGSGGRGMSGHPSIPTIAIQDTGDSSFSEGEYYSGSDRLHRQALEANVYRGSSSSLTSLYSTGEEFYGKYPITGDVSFGLGYNFKTNVFEVKIGGCRDLVPIDAKKNKSDPYIKTYLLPDKSKNSKRKTRTKKGTINPNYSENLKYPIAQSELETRTLSVAIWHYDRFGHNMFLGEVMLPLDGLDLTSYPVKWHQLKTRVAPNETRPISYKGDIVLALMFETLLDENKNGTSGSKSSLRRKKKGPSSKQIGGCLKIHIKEAKNLTPPRVGAVVNPYVKVYLEPDRSKTGKKKTSTMRNTLNPSYEQSLEFPNVTQDILKERALEVGIWDSEIGSSSLLGGVRLGSGTGKSYGRGVEWQDSTGIEIQLWEEMLRNHNQWVEACLTLRASFDKDKKT